MTRRIGPIGPIGPIRPIEPTRGLPPRQEARAIGDAAREKGVYVLTDYHKRHDRAIRAARTRYARGELGEMPLKWFARWCGESSPFEHIGVHYADAYFFRGYADPDDPDRTEWVGYGYDSILQGIVDIQRIVAETRGLDPTAALRRRRALLDELEPIRALPSQALVGTAINEAVRLSIANDSAYVAFDDDLTPVPQ